MSKLQQTIGKIRPLDESAMEQARIKQNLLTKPQGSLGKLEDLSIMVAGIQRTALPRIKDKVILTMAGDHGVTAEGVAMYPSEVTVQQVLNFLKGGGGVNVLSRHVGARVTLVDMGVDHDFDPAPGLLIKKIARGTCNISRGPAMTREQAVMALEAGIEAAEEEHAKGMDIMGTGEMGIGNTTPSTAIVCAVTGISPELATGRGAGLSDEGLEKKVAAIKRAIEVNRPDPEDGIDVLSKVGGYEIAGIAGSIIGAASMGVPAVVDGYISTAGALVAYLICPAVKDYMISSHKSVEIGHEYMLEYMGLEPLLDLDLRLGEGTGGALAITIIESSVKILNEMATFESAGVSGPKEE
jgi:nicotinate-nucleotide--dimethylbenzimidazole phosphoribosyltransferase